MKNITINQAIGILSVVIQFTLVIFTATLLSQGLWWVANPLGYDTYDNISSKSLDSAKLAQTIINRAPFGIISQEKAPVPTIADQIKVVGVYAAGPNNSIAFITTNGKNSIAAIGDTVLDSKVKAITPNGVIFRSQNQDVTINLSSASSSASSGNHNDSHAPAPAANNTNNNSYIPSSNNNNNNSQAAQQGQPQANANDNGSDNDNDSIADKRRKMIEAFQKQNSTGNDNANNGQQN